MDSFPLLDSSRSGANEDLFRQVLVELGKIEPSLDEIDGWCTMPLRLSHNASAGLVLEIGPYDLHHEDVNVLREAIRQYDIAIQGGPGLRRIK